VIAQQWSKKYLDGSSLEKGTTLRHPRFPHVLATPDYYTPTGVLEIKAPGYKQIAHWGHDGDDLPERYLIQVQQQCAVTGRDHWHLAALMGGQELRCYEGEADPELQSGLCDAIERFWSKHVAADSPPELDASDDTKKWLASRYAQTSKRLRRATKTETDLVAAYIDARAALKEAQERHDILRAGICNTIRDDDGIEGPFGRITFKLRKGYRVEAFEVKETRSFRADLIGD